MKIKKFNEFENLNESVVELDEHKFMTAGDLMHFIRKNIPKETLIFHEPCDSPIRLIKKEDINKFFGGIQDMYLYETTEDSYLRQMDEEYGEYDIMEEKMPDNTINGEHMDKEPLIVKGINLNRYL